MALALRPRAILKMSGTVFQDTDPPADKWSYVSIYYTLNNKMKLACGFFFHSVKRSDRQKGVWKMLKKQAKWL